uniref:hypothetical protein n=1 Tax=Stenotrophomonas maltophilia TaxID=40324 RepID=UPI0019549A0A
MKTNVVMGWLCASAVLIASGMSAWADDNRRIEDLPQDTKPQGEGAGSPTSPLTTPAMAGPLTANPNPTRVDAGALG